MSSRIAEVCDAIVAGIAASWSPPAGSGVERVYLAPVNAESISGRRVYVFPARYTDEPADRGEQLTGYTIAVLVAERFTDPGQPTVAWVDERVEFVESEIYDLVGNYGSNVPFLEVTGHGKIWAETADATVYDPEMLATKKLFWAELEFTLREIK